MTCQPAGPTDTTCLGTIINDFGLRAYRRPVAVDEVARLQALAADAVNNGQDFDGQVKQVVKMMLSSIPFLYRVELDATPASTAPHRVSPYELATRLSYLVWSTMPDAQLFADAQSGALATDATLEQELARMLQDTRASSPVQLRGAMARPAHLEGPPDRADGLPCLERAAAPSDDSGGPALLRRVPERQPALDAVPHGARELR